VIIFSPASLNYKYPELDLVISKTDIFAGPAVSYLKVTQVAESLPNRASVLGSPAALLMVQQPPERISFFPQPCLFQRNLKKFPFENQYS
jgi:hypothetical protein